MDFTADMALTAYRVPLDAGATTALGTADMSTPLTLNDVQGLSPDVIALVVSQKAASLTAPVVAKVLCVTVPRASGQWRLQEVTTAENPAEDTAVFTFSATTSPATREAETGVRWMGRYYPDEGGSVAYEVFIQGNRTKTLDAVALPLQL
jgi:hypothetical protein